MAEIEIPTAGESEGARDRFNNWIAVAVALFQAFLVTLAVAVVVLAGGIPIFQAWWTLGKVPALLLLLFLVPLLVFLAARRSIFLGVVAGEIVLLAGQLWWH